MDFKIEFFLRETRSFFQFLKVSRVVKERFLCVRRIRLQFLNCPAFELWKIYGQGNGLSVSRPEITQFLTSWETRLPGKLSLFNVSFFHRDVGKTWTFDSLGLIYLSFLFFFFYKFTENCHGFIIYRVIIYTMHGLLRKQRAENRAEEARFATTWNLLAKMNDTICDIYLAHDERTLLIGCNFTKIAKILGSFALSLRFIVGVECWKKKDRISQFLWKRNKGEWCFVCQEEADRILVRACNIV